MQPWEGQLNDARSVDDVMVAVCDFLNHQRAERHDALLPVNCRHIVLTTPSDIEWWLRELEAANPGYGAARMILQTTRQVLQRAWERLNALGYHSPRALGTR